MTTVSKRSVIKYPNIKRTCSIEENVCSGESNAFFDERFSKARITRSRLRNKFLNKKTRKCDSLCETGITVFHF